MKRAVLEQLSYRGGRAPRDSNGNAVADSEQNDVDDSGQDLLLNRDGGEDGSNEAECAGAR